MGTANFNSYTAKGSFGSLEAKAAMGGQGVSNNLMRGYTYPEAMPVEPPPNIVTTPQPFKISFTDANGSEWILPVNATVWVLVNVVEG